MIPKAVSFAMHLQWMRGLESRRRLDFQKNVLLIATNPALQPNSRFHGSKVAMLSGTVPRFCKGTDSTAASFQDCKVADFELQGYRVLDYQGSEFQVFRVQGSKFQASRFQTCRGLSLVHQQRNDQRNAKHPQNTIEVLQFM